MEDIKLDEMIRYLDRKKISTLSKEQIEILEKPIQEEEVSQSIKNIF